MPDPSLPESSSPESHRSLRSLAGHSTTEPQGRYERGESGESRHDADIGLCDLCGSEDGPRFPMQTAGGKAWACPTCRAPFPDNPPSQENPMTTTGKPFVVAPKTDADYANKTWGDRYGVDWCYPGDENFITVPSEPEGPPSPHTRTTPEWPEAGADYCAECSEAISDLVPWPCPASGPPSPPSDAELEAPYWMGE